MSCMYHLSVHLHANLMHTMSNLDPSDVASGYSESFENCNASLHAGPVVVEKDEFPRHSTTAEALGRLRPAFLQDGSGTVTAGNSSGINDGAAAIVLSSRQQASHLGCLKPLARIVSWAQAGVDPSVMGMGPVPAVRMAVSRCISLKSRHHSAFYLLPPSFSSCSALYLCLSPPSPPTLFLFSSKGRTGMYRTWTCLSSTRPSPRNPSRSSRSWNSTRRR